MHRKPLHIILAAAFLAAAGVLYGVLTRRPAVTVSGSAARAGRPHDSRRDAGATAGGTPALQSRRDTVRRDADYWPQEPRPIALRHRTVLPSRDFPNEPGLGLEQVTVWLVQFGGPLGAEDVAALRTRGIEILLPSAGGAFHARAAYAALKAAAVADAAPRVLGWCRLCPQDKLLPAVAIERTTWPEEAKVGVYNILRRIDLYSFGDPRAVAEAVRRLGGIVHNVQSWTRNAAPALEVSGPAGLDFSLKLAALEGVYAIDLPQPRKRVWNQQAASASNVPTVQAAPLSLTGSGVTVMVRDEGRVFEHPDFGTRLLWAPDVAAQVSVQHSTHVAGTIGGTGLADPAALAKGMASGCTLVSYDLQGDDAAEPLQAKANYGAILSNHSYGFATGWDGGAFLDNQSTFGIYSSFARSWDQIVLSDGLIMVKAVGNSRDGSGPIYPHNGTLAPDGEYYDTTDASATGKNILVVGGAMDGASASAPGTGNVVLASSSSGPCDDGRLRPEIIANGEIVNSCNNSAVAGNQYASITGTSMACAVVTGATALFLESSRLHYGTSVPPAPHFIRAVYAQTAVGFGRPGPDYLHGFGLLDLLAAVRLVEADTPAGSRIVSSSLSADTPERFYVLNSDGVTDIKATLCWTDQPGDVLTASALVNNLDLHLVRAGDQAVFFPFQLDPAHPDLPAATAANNVDTIEQVVLSAPAPGSYLLSVHAATLATAASFALASSQALTEDLAPVARINPSSTQGAPPFQVTFDGTASSDPDGGIARYLWSFGDGATAEGPLVQHTYNTGNYKATLTVIDNQGASAATSVVIAVDNKLPVAVAVATPDTGLPPLTCLLSGVGSHDPDGQITSYAWDFGDGTTGPGVQVSHTYTVPGLYFATLTVTDDGNASDAQTVTVLAGAGLSPSSSRFSLNFQKSGYDRFTLSSKNVPISPDLVTTTGLAGSVRLGGAEYPFVLDEKGRYNVAPLKVRLVPSRQQITISLSRLDIVGALSSSGATSRDVQNQILKIPFALQLSDTVAGSSGLPYNYSAKKGKTGRGRLIVPK